MNQNRDHLIPTAVTDKNGKQTTVHKKAVTETTNPTWLPKVSFPTVNRIQKRMALENETTALLVNLNYNDPSRREQSYHYFLQLLTPYSDATLQRFKDVMTEHGGMSAYSLAVALTENRTEDYLNDWITIEPVGHDMEAETMEYMINSLGEYKNLAPQDSGNYPELRTRQVRAIAHLTNHYVRQEEGFNEDLNSNGKLMQIIADEKLRNLLTTHEDPEAVADIIITRDMTDPEQITEVSEAMRSTPSALNEGSL